MTREPLRVGIVGLGQAFMLMIPTLRGHEGVEVVAAADPRPEARRQFEADFGGRTFASVDEICRDPDIEALYVATPHQFHAEHVALAARHAKHVLVEKPMALDIDDCRSMISTVERAGVHMVVGHTHALDAPIQRAREIVASGDHGAVRMISTLNYTDFLYRLRRPDELNTDIGGGAILNQAPHQVDIVRLLAGSGVRSVRAVSGDWDPQRSTEGAYTAILTFESGAFATITYNGYGHFDSDEFQGWIDELGRPKFADEYQNARLAFRSHHGGPGEAEAKSRRIYGGADYRPDDAQAEAGPAALHQHFGLVLISCERADIRPMPRGVMIYGENERTFEPLPAPAIPRAEVLDELCAVVRGERSNRFSGQWGMATMEVCFAIRQSARESREIHLPRRHEA